MATLRRLKGSPNWYLDVRLPDGHRKRISLETSDRKLASTKARLLEREILGNKPIERPTFDQFEAEYLEWMSSVASPQYKQSQSYALKRFREICPRRYLDEVTRKDVDLFKGRLLGEKVSEHSDRTISPHTVDMYLRTLRSSFNTAVKWGYLEANPFKGVQFLHEELPDPRVLSDREKEKLFGEIRKLYPAEVPAFEFLLQTGIRRSELIRLDWPDVNFDKNVILIRNVHKGKRRERRPRVVPLLPRAREILMALDRSQRPFALNADTLTRHYRKAADAAQVPNTELHDLRRTFTSYLLSKGVPRDVVDRIVGHTDFSVTDAHYFSLSEDVLEQFRTFDISRFGRN
jgi:integrase